VSCMVSAELHMLVERLASMLWRWVQFTVPVLTRLLISGSLPNSQCYRMTDHHSSADSRLAMALAPSVMAMTR
jgi:hypothetical protein